MRQHQIKDPVERAAFQEFVEGAPRCVHGVEPSSHVFISDLTMRVGAESCFGAPPPKKAKQSWMTPAIVVKIKSRRKWLSQAHQAGQLMGQTLPRFYFMTLGLRLHALEAACCLWHHASVAYEYAYHIVVSRGGAPSGNHG